jgi:hypothetical protein
MVTECGLVHRTVLNMQACKPGPDKTLGDYLNDHSLSWEPKHVRSALWELEKAIRALRAELKSIEN